MFIICHILQHNLAVLVSSNMVSIGTTFGGFLYDTFLFTGESPMNTPWLGLKRVVRPKLEDWSTGAAARAAERREQQQQGRSMV